MCPVRRTINIVTTKNLYFEIPLKQIIYFQLHRFNNGIEFKLSLCVMRNQRFVTILN